MTSTNARMAIRNISNCTTDPTRTGEKMLKAAKLNNILVKRVQTGNVLSGLEVRRIGTNEIESMAKKLLRSDKRDEGVVTRLVGLAKEAARKRERDSRRTFQMARREAERSLPAGWMRRCFSAILRQEAQSVWHTLRVKNAKKKDHLENRHRPRKEQGRFRGIPIGDEELGPDGEVVGCLTYGVVLSSCEEEYLRLPNCVTDFMKVDEEKMITEIHSMAAKLRMSVREVEENKEVEGGGESEVAEVAEVRRTEELEVQMASKRVFDRERGVADFRRKKVTDSKLKKRITVPGPVDVNNEGKILSLVNILENLVKKEAKKEGKTKSASGDERRSTLTKEQSDGRSSLKKREKDGELVLVGSDKSGKRAAMKKDMYVSLMEPHILGDIAKTREDVDSKERLFNGAAGLILRAFRVGGDWKHEARFKSAYTACHNQVPSVNQLVKDHKETLKTRPVCRAQASQTPNGPLAELIGEILYPFIEAANV